MPDQLVLKCSCGEELRAGVLFTFCEECKTDHTSSVQEVERALKEHHIRLQYCDHEGEKSRKDVYKAGEIVRALTQGTSQTQRSEGTNNARSIPNLIMGDTSSLGHEVEPSLKLTDTVVIGPLKLRHKSIAAAVDMKDSWFLGKVDVRCSEFKGAVNFSYCTFYQEFNSGDSEESYTAFRKELNCTGARFVQAAKFNGIRVESSAYFNESSFEFKGTDKTREADASTDYLVDFTDSSFGSNVECMRTVFKGAASFNSLKCGGAGFFDHAKFIKEANFVGASFESNVEFNDAVFEGAVSFNSLKCGGAGFFGNAKFMKAKFTSASFESNVEFNDAVFEGAVSFNSLKCGGAGIFDRAKFVKEASLRLSSFDSILNCQNTEFGGELDSSLMKCAYDSNFERAEFKEEVNFRGLQCGGSGIFNGASFLSKKTLDCRYSRFDRDLDLRNAYCAGTLELGQARVLNKLRLGASRFDSKAEFYSANINVLELMDANYQDMKYPLRVRVSKEPYSITVVAETAEKLHKIFTSEQAQKVTDTVEDLFPFQQCSLNLTDVTFERFHGGPNRELAKNLAKKLVKEQNPKKFSRDPYLQLAMYYNRIGEEDDALHMHYSGRSALRANARDFRKYPDKGRVRWPWIKIWVTDFGLKYLTGYGYKTYLAAITLTPFLILGTLILWGDSTLVKKSDLSSMGYVSFWDSLLFNVDLLIPVLTFPHTDPWSPYYFWGKLIAGIEVLVGWLIVPLAIAAWTGIIRSRSG